MRGPSLAWRTSQIAPNRRTLAFSFVVLPCHVEQTAVQHLPPMLHAIEAAPTSWGGLSGRSEPAHDGRMRLQPRTTYISTSYHITKVNNPDARRPASVIRHTQRRVPSGSGLSSLLGTAAAAGVGLLPAWGRTVISPPCGPGSCSGLQGSGLSPVLPCSERRRCGQRWGAA
jgi:hypothetical protein